jgi:hypothetical protein
MYRFEYNKLQQHKIVKDIFTWYGIKPHTTL